jgi:hypothetical protein
MKKLTFFIILIFNCTHNAISQSRDTISAKVIWVKNLKECLLIGVISPCDQKDTSVFISSQRSNIIKVMGSRKIEIGRLYIFAVEKEIPIGSPTKNMTVKFKNTIVWTNKESFRLKPRVCFNCFGTFIK